MIFGKDGKPIRYNCLMCGFVCLEKKDFIKHLMNEKYIKRIDKYTKCSKCDFKFGTQDSDIPHVCKLINPPIECNFCGKIHRNKYSADMHHVKCGKLYTKKFIQENRSIVNDNEDNNTDENVFEFINSIKLTKKHKSKLEEIIKTYIIQKNNYKELLHGASWFMEKSLSSLTKIREELELEHEKNMLLRKREYDRIQFKKRDDGDEDIEYTY